MDGRGQVQRDGGVLAGRGKGRKGCIDRVFAHTVGTQPVADRLSGKPAPMEGIRAAFRKAAVIQKTGTDEPGDERLDQGPAGLRLLPARRGGPLHLAEQHLAEPLRRGGETGEIGASGVLQRLRSGRRRQPAAAAGVALALAGHYGNSRPPPGNRTISMDAPTPFGTDIDARWNWRGLWTLYQREVRRFLKVYTQTIVAPVVTTLLFMAIFALALGRAVESVKGLPFLEYIAPGLIMMAIAQNAFANTSSSIVIAKVQGNIVDTLMPPLDAHELTLGIALGGVTRGLVVGLVVAVSCAPFVALHLSHFGFIVYHGVMASLMLSLLGVAGGIWSEKFDHIAAVTNFLVTPLSFLSGTFYSIDRLPETFQSITLFNPFFYMIDGFRYGFIGVSDVPPWQGVIVMAAVNTALWLLCYRMFATGYKLKA